MPKVELVSQLIRLIGQRNFEKAKQIAEVMVAEEKAKNRNKAALTLEHAIKSWPHESKLVELPKEIADRLWTEEPCKSLKELYLHPMISQEIELFLQEREHVEKLRSVGLPVRNKVFLAGPPGNGKTSLAGALSKTLNLSFFTLKLEKIIDSHLGDTGRNLEKVFNHAMFNPVLLFIDEVDALCSARTGDLTGANKENNRIVNAILMNLDRVPDSTVIVFASNMMDHIDPAIERRFNLKLWLTGPTNQGIQNYLSDYQQKNSIVLEDVSQITKNLSGQSWATIEQFCINRHKEFILGGLGLSNVGWVGR